MIHGAGYPEDEVRAMPIICTDHAIKRVKKRFNLPMQSVERFATKAVSHGEFYGTFQGMLRATFTKDDRTFVFQITTTAGLPDPILLLITAHPSRRPKSPPHKEIRLKGNTASVTPADRKPYKAKQANVHRKNNKHKNAYKGHHDE